MTTHHARRRIAVPLLAAGALAAGLPAVSAAAPPVHDGQSVTVTGGVRKIADGALIVYDQGGQGHRLLAQGPLAAQLPALVGHRVTVTGVAQVDNRKGRVHWPIRVATVADLGLLTPAPAPATAPAVVNGQAVTVTGATRGLRDRRNTVIIVDERGEGHRLYGPRTVQFQLALLVGNRLTVTGTAVVTNPKGRIHWPIRVGTIANLGPQPVADGQAVSLTGPVALLRGARPAVVDADGHLHRLIGAVDVHSRLLSLAGHRVTVTGTALVRVAVKWRNYPIQVTSVTDLG